MVTKRAARPKTAVAPVRRRFTLTEWDAMVEAGIFDEDERIELIEGEILCMAPIGILHAWVVTRLNNWFSRRLPETMLVRVQDPIHLPEHSEPEPDLVIVPAHLAEQGSRHPIPDDIRLLIEVASSSLGFDREIKLPLYAAAGISEVWIVDIDGQRVLVYRAPRRGRYAEQRVVERGGTLTPLAFPELTLTLDDVLGPRE